MIGQTVNSQSHPTLGLLAIVFIGALLVVLAVIASKVLFAILSILPFVLALTLWCCHSKSLCFQLTDTRLDFTNGEDIPYSSMEGLWINGEGLKRNEVKLKRSVITLLHQEGSLQIPAHLNVRSDDLYRFLLDRFTLAGSRDVNEVLVDHLRQEIQLFGEDRVTSYRGRGHLGHTFGLRGKLLPALVALLLTGISWMIIDQMLVLHEEWTSAGIFFCFVAIGLMAFGWVARSPRFVNKIRREASVIISPGGVAMVQGKIKGKMRWDELRDVRYVSKRRGRQRGINQRGILLRVEGTSFFIMDVYERPLPVIYGRILASRKQTVAAEA